MFWEYIDMLLHDNILYFRQLCGDILIYQLIILTLAISWTIYIMCMQVDTNRHWAMQVDYI